MTIGPPPKFHGNRDILTSWNRGEPGGRALYELEYLLVVARKRQ